MANTSEPEEWLVKDILAENVKKRLYKIEWEGLNPDTLQPWEPTWEPYSCVSEGLREEWEAKKAALDRQGWKRSTKAHLRSAEINRRAGRRAAGTSSSSSDNDDGDDAGDYEGNTSGDVSIIEIPRRQSPQDGTKQSHQQQEQQAKKRKRASHSVVYPGIESGSSYEPTSQSTTSVPATTTDSSQHSRSLESNQDSSAFASSESAQAQTSKKRKVSFGSIMRQRVGSESIEEFPLPQEEHEEAFVGQDDDSQPGRPIGLRMKNKKKSGYRIRLDENAEPIQLEESSRGPGRLLRPDEKEERERAKLNAVRRSQVERRRARDKRHAAERDSRSPDYALPSEPERPPPRPAGFGVRILASDESLDEDDAQEDRGDDDESSPRLRQQTDSDREASAAPRSRSPPVRKGRPGGQPDTSRQRPVPQLPDSLVLRTETFHTSVVINDFNGSDIFGTVQPTPAGSANRKPSSMASTSIFTTAAGKSLTPAQRKAHERAQKERRLRESGHLSIGKGKVAKSHSPIAQQRPAALPASTEGSHRKSFAAVLPESQPLTHLPSFKRRTASDQPAAFPLTPEDPAGHLFADNIQRHVDAEGWPIYLNDLAENTDQDQTSQLQGDESNFPDARHEPEPAETSFSATQMVPDSQIPGRSREQAVNGINISSSLPADRLRTLRPVAVPEPRVFQPFLSAEDHIPAGQLSSDIDQFSSQPQRATQLQQEDEAYDPRRPATTSISSNPYETARIPKQYIVPQHSRVLQPISLVSKPLVPPSDRFHTARIESKAEWLLRQKTSQSPERALSRNGHAAEASTSVLQGAAREESDKLAEEVSISHEDSDNFELQQPITFGQPTSPKVQDTREQPAVLAPELLSEVAQGSQEGLGQVQDGNASAAFGEEQPAIITSSTSVALAKSKIRTGGLLTDADLKSEISIFMEAPEYYVASGRSLTQKEKWEIELEEVTEPPSKWFLVIEPASHSWRLEQRSDKPVAPMRDGGPEAQDQDAYVKLAAAHAALQKSLDTALLKVGNLETELAISHARSQEAATRSAQLGTENDALRAEVKRLKASLDLGIRQIQLIAQAKEQKLKEELDVARKQVALAQEVAARTDSAEIRAKAARTDELEARERRRLANTIDWPAASTSSAAYGLPLPGGAVAGSSYPTSTSLQLMEDDESEDEDFQAGTSDGDSSSSSSSDSDGSEAAIPPLSEHVEPGSRDVQAMETSQLQPVSAEHAIRGEIMDLDRQTSGPSTTEPQTLQSVLAQAEIALREGPQADALPPLFGGLVPTALSHFDQAQPPAHIGSVQNDPFANVVPTDQTLLDTSGETTEVTPASVNTSSIEPQKHQFIGEARSAAVVSDLLRPSAGNTSSAEVHSSEEILELDSALLDNQEAYPCRYHVTPGNECGELFDSQKALFAHMTAHDGSS